MTHQHTHKIDTHIKHNPAAATSKGIDASRIKSVSQQQQQQQQQCQQHESKQNNNNNDNNKKQQQQKTRTRFIPTSE